MGFVQIPNLPGVASISPDSLFECVVGGVSVKVTAQQIIDSIVGPYLPISGGTMTGQLKTLAAVDPSDAINKAYVDNNVNLAKLGSANTFTQDITIAEINPTIILNDTDATVGGTMNSRLNFQASGAYNGFCGFNGAQLNIECPNNSIGFRANTSGFGGTTYIYLSTANGTTDARVDISGTTSGSAQTVITREKGDARYAPIASDARLKTDVKDMPITALSAIMELRPVTYEWIQSEEDPKPTGTRYGLIAQEVQEVLPAAILGSEENYLGLDPLSLIGVLVKAVQELNAKISVLEKANATKAKK